MFKVMLETQQNKGKINQPCLTPFVGCGREQSEGPDFVWESTSSLKGRGEVCASSSRSRSKYFESLSHQRLP